MSIESVMLYSHLILCCSLLLCLQSFPASGSFPMSWLFASGGQSIGDSALFLPMSIQGWFPLGWTGLISLLQLDIIYMCIHVTQEKVGRSMYWRTEPLNVFPHTEIHACVQIVSFLKLIKVVTSGKWEVRLGRGKGRVHYLFFLVWFDLFIMNNYWFYKQKRKKIPFLWNLFFFHSL